MHSLILTTLGFVRTLWHQLAAALGWPPDRVESPDQDRCPAEALEQLRSIQAQREQKFALLQHHLPSRAVGSPWEPTQQPSQFTTEIAAAFGIETRPSYATQIGHQEVPPFERVFDASAERKFYASLPTQIRFVRELAAYLRMEPIRTERDAEAQKLLSSLGPVGSDPAASLECLRLNYQNVYDRWIDRTREERATLRAEEARSQSVYTETLARYAKIAKEADRASEDMNALNRARTRFTSIDGILTEEVQARVSALPDPQPWVQPLKDPADGKLYGAQLHQLQDSRDKTLRKVSAYQHGREVLTARTAPERSRSRVQSLTRS